MSRIIAWGNKVDQAFRDRLDQGIADMGWEDGNGLMASKVMSCMAFETGATFDPSIRNRAGSSGTGLIQFMASTAEELGTTTDALAAMSAVKQLDYVFRYFKMFRKLQVPSPLLSDLYMSILMPKYIGEPDDSIIFHDGLQYSENAGLDTNRDGVITKQEVAAKVQARLTTGYQTPNVWTDAE
jgi:hypothetical protein